ncbi:MAG: hypothetical protein IJ086_13930 [Clostridium sp.]|nr:hypothetical protein [Clostridium sp.]MBQ9072671.1 hypothetical protein [Bacilli bacterium]
MKNFKLCNNMGIQNQINTLYTDYSIAENELFILMNSKSDSNDLEANRMEVVDKINDMQYRLRMLKDYIYNCSLIDDEDLN